MAKSKSFFGLRKGSTKTLTFQVVNGAQVTKDRVAFVKNPRTESQMANRCLMATASAAYRAMREIVDHSFEGYTYGQQNMSRFIAQNITLLRNNAAIGATEFGYNRYRDRAFHAGAYKISKGSLTPTLYSVVTDYDDTYLLVELASGSLSENYTVDDIAAAFGLAVGEMTTICFIYGNNEVGWKFGYIRFKRIGMGNVPVTTQEDFESGFQVSSNLGRIIITPYSNYISLDVLDTPVIQNGKCYWGVIYSRHTSQGWLRSTAYIEVPDGVELTPDYDTALATYPQGSNYILNGGTVSGGGGRSNPPSPGSMEDLVGQNISLISRQQILAVLSELPVNGSFYFLFNGVYIIITKLSDTSLTYNCIACQNNDVSGAKAFELTSIGLDEWSLDAVVCDTVITPEYMNEEFGSYLVLLGYNLQDIQEFTGSYLGAPEGNIEY